MITLPEFQAFEGFTDGLLDLQECQSGVILLTDGALGAYLMGENRSLSIS